MNAALVQLATSGRYSRAGLAHAAADVVTDAAGKPWRMAFRPRTRTDSTPFTIEESSDA